MKCVDKIAYNTRGEAWDFVKTFRRSAKHKSRCYVYECQFCGKWHITHYRPDRFKAKKAASVNHRYDYKQVTDEARRTRF